jgi:Rrf2 family transcriptional regulator, iron-sulfur cluster assembly transcription factor
MRVERATRASSAAQVVPRTKRKAGLGAMLRPSKKLVLALEAVADIAFHGGAEPVQSQDIARRLNLPRRYLEQVMQQLVRAGILRGVRGPRGGYRLARERRRVSVADVVRVVRGIEEPPSHEDFGSSSDLGRKVIGPFWASTERDLMARLEKVTVEDLCRRAEDHGVSSEARADVDFAI